MTEMPPGAGTLAMQLPKDLAGHRFRIANAVVNSEWLKEFARQVAEEAWADGEAAGRDNVLVEEGRLDGLPIVGNPHSSPRRGR